ncbi:MAG TPA: transposase, partial [Actinomycetes bacterium]
RASTDMTRRCGRSPRGERPGMPVPHGRWRTTTFVAALRSDGLTAATVVAGAMTGELFEAYVKRRLVPTPRPGDVAAMDNLAVHERAGVREAIEGAGCRRRYPPPYSPDLDPIEQAFAEPKAFPRRAGERTVEGRWGLVGRLPDEFGPAECRNYLRHCGYAATPS